MMAKHIHVLLCERVLLYFLLLVCLFVCVLVSVVL